jgi:hypothetical protein
MKKNVPIIAVLGISCFAIGCNSELADSSNIDLAGAQLVAQADIDGHLVAIGETDEGSFLVAEVVPDGQEPVFTAKAHNNLVELYRAMTPVPDPTLLARLEARPQILLNDPVAADERGTGLTTSAIGTSVTRSSGFANRFDFESAWCITTPTYWTGCMVNTQSANVARRAAHNNTILIGAAGVGSATNGGIVISYSRRRKHDPWQGLAAITIPGNHWGYIADNNPFSDLWTVRGDLSIVRHSADYGHIALNTY